MECSYQVLNLAVNKDIGYNGPKVKANPYYGCEHRCLFCPANDGFLNKKVFDDFRQVGMIRVVDNIVEHIDNYISKAKEKVTVHLSPVSDPFQVAEDEFKKSLEIINYCKSNNIDIAVCTKGLISEEAFKALSGYKNSFVQISLITINEKKRSFIVRGNGASVDELLDQIKALTRAGINTLIRVDPIFPYITDNMEEFRQIVDIVSKIGITCVLSSCADICNGALAREAGYLNSYETGLSVKYNKLYTENIDGRIHAKSEYRKKLFQNMLDICLSAGIGFGITWEPDTNGNSLSPLFSRGSEMFLNNMK